MVKLKELKEKLKTLHRKHERAFEVIAFIGGFTFDAIMVTRIDEPFCLIQQFFYLFFLGVILYYEVKFEFLKIAVPAKAAKLWSYRKVPFHFVLGTLLNIYTIFFFKAGSLVTSFVFLVLIASLIVLNELPFVRNLGVLVKVIFYSLCLACFWIIMWPIGLGKIGWIPFLAAIATSAAVLFAMYKKLERLVPNDRKPLQKNFLLPSEATLVIFILFYLVGFIPPVPMSLNFIGIYHKVEKAEGEYKLYYSRPEWKFWQKGDQTFLAQPGDKIHCFVEVFSPTNFRDTVKLKFLYDDPKLGWHAWDAIPLTVSGGREEGFRGFGVKQNYQPGDWQVRVLTSDDREIGRINFTVEAEPPSDLRKFNMDQR